MKQSIYTLLAILMGLHSFAQNVDKTTELNGIALRVNISAFDGDLYLITGNEPAYSEAPTLQNALKKKIGLGIRDASYQGNEFRQFGAYEASNITFQFFNNELYKVQWTFRNRLSLEETYHFLVDTYADKFGISKEQVFDDFRQVEWQGRVHYVQVFMDNDSDVTLVFKDKKISKKVRKVLAKSNSGFLR